MKKIFAFFFSCMFLLPLMAGAQDSTQLFRSLTFIGKLKGPIIHLFDDSRSSYAAGIDLQFRENIYLGITAGIASYERLEDNYQYSSEGNFYKAGFKYDFLKRQRKDSKDITFTSIRFGYASLSHSADSIKFRYDLLGDGIYSIPEENMNAFWLEIGGGIRVELFYNIMIGWNLHGAIMLKKPEHEIMSPYLIPGFGKAENGFVLDLEYNIAYIIPFKSKTKPPSK